MKFEKGETVSVVDLQQEGKVMNIITDGKSYHRYVVMLPNGWHRLCVESELEKAKKDAKRNHM